MPRLIDADALNLEYEVDMADDWKTAHEIANIVKYAPTIDAVPVKRGHWIFETIGRHGVMTCSECLKVQDYQTACFTYCPNCGARMDEE